MWVSFSFFLVCYFQIQKENKVLYVIDYYQIFTVEIFFSQSQEMTLNDGGFLNAVRDGSCTYVLNLLDNGGIDLEQQDQVKK